MLAKGKNSELVHNSERYHIQTETCPPEDNILISQVFRQGQVILKQKYTLENGEGLSDAGVVLKAHDLAIKELKELLI